MPTKPRAPDQAATSAEHEALQWADVAARWHPSDHHEWWSRLPGTERDIVLFHDPRGDIDRRARRWGYEPSRCDLADLARFAAGLAQAEAEAWRDDRPHVATQAYADRRFLAGDRIMHWSVPWLDAVGRAFPKLGSTANETSSILLEIGDRLRPAPGLGGSEGLVLPGSDSFGPLEVESGLEELIGSLWSGAVITMSDSFHARGVTPEGRPVDAAWLSDPTSRSVMRDRYQAAAHRWDELASRHPGTAALWQDLARRAERTARRLSA